MFILNYAIFPFACVMFPSQKDGIFLQWTDENLITRRTWYFSKRTFLLLVVGMCRFQWAVVLEAVVEGPIWYDFCPAWLSWAKWVPCNNRLCANSPTWWLKPQTEHPFLELSFSFNLSLSFPHSLICAVSPHECAYTHTHSLHTLIPFLALRFFPLYSSGSRPGVWCF